MSNEEALRIRFNRVLSPSGMNPPKPANNFAWTRIENAYHFQTSYYDPMSYALLLSTLASQGENKNEEDIQDLSLDCQVTDSFMLTPKDVLELHSAVTMMFNDALASGLILQANSQDTEAKES